MFLLSRYSKLSIYILFVGADSLLCLFGAYFPLILSYIARYTPSSESKIASQRVPYKLACEWPSVSNLCKICIQIDHKILLSNFEHLLINWVTLISRGCQAPPWWF